MLSSDAALGRPSTVAPIALGPSRVSAATIVVADDETDLREVVVAYLTRQGFSVRSAANAPELRAQLAAAPADLVVLDIAMPGEDGLSVTRRLRAGATTSAS